MRCQKEMAKHSRISGVLDLIKTLHSSGTSCGCQHIWQLTHLHPAYVLLFDPFIAKHDHSRF